MGTPAPAPISSWRWERPALGTECCCVNREGHEARQSWQDCDDPRLAHPYRDRVAVAIVRLQRVVPERPAPVQLAWAVQRDTTHRR